MITDNIKVINLFEYPRQWLSIREVSEFNTLVFKDNPCMRLTIEGFKQDKEPLYLGPIDYPHGGVNLYHVDVWQMVYPKLRLPVDKPGTNVSKATHHVTLT